MQQKIYINIQYVIDNMALYMIGLVQHMSCLKLSYYNYAQSNVIQNHRLYSLTRDSMKRDHTIKIR